MSIILTDVSYIYMRNTPYERKALQSINLEIDRGEFLGVIGHTGSGKSTLMQQLNGLLKPTAGQVSVDGTDLHSGAAGKAARRKVGMVFQYPEHQLFEETVYADIAFGPRNLALTEPEVDARVRQAMQFVGLDYEQYAERSPFRLSGGQMRCVAIAGVIALQPAYLILDEPSAGLDPRGRDEIFGHMLTLQRETGITIVLVSHNMEEIVRLTKRIIVMNHGQICLDGQPRDIFRRELPRLHAAGVDAPQVHSLLCRLQAQGLPVDTGAMTPEEAAATILAAVRGSQPC